MNVVTSKRSTGQRGRLVRIAERILGNRDEADADNADVMRRD